MSNQEQEKKKAEVLDKIRALMSKTLENGATEAEAEAAMKAAQRLMMKYNIDNEEVTISPLDIAETVLDNEFKTHEYKYWFFDVLCALAEINSCEVIKSWVPVTGSYYRIIGTIEDRTVVKNTFETLYPIIRNIEKARWKDRYKQFEKLLEEHNLKVSDAPMSVWVKQKLIPSRKTHFESYYKGFIRGLKDKMLADKEDFLALDDNRTKYELIIIKKEDIIANWMTERFPDIKPLKKKKKALDHDAYWSGKADGKDNDMSTKLGS